MKKNQRIIIIIICILNIVGIGVQANSDPTDCQTWLDEFVSSDWQTQNRLLMQLEQCKEIFSSNKIDEVKNALLGSLETEVKFQLKHHEEIGEGRGEHLLDLMDSTIRFMPNDERIVKPIINSFAVVGGKMPEEAVASFGEQALPALMDVLNATSSETELNSDWVESRQKQVLRVLSVMIKNEKLSSKIIDQEIKPVLFKTIKNPNPFIRQETIEVMGSIGDTSFIARLEEVAQNDPFSLGEHETKSGEIIQNYYPNRELAKEVILKILN